MVDGGSQAQTDSQLVHTLPTKKDTVMNRIFSKSVLRPATATVMTAALLGSGMTGTALAATSATGGSAVRPAVPAPAHTGRVTHLACPGIGFTVVHNDRSGGVILPAGHYRVWSPRLSCRTASAYFTTFLNRHQGTIPGWSGKQIGVGYGVYTQSRTGDTFAVQHAGWHAG